MCKLTKWVFIFFLIGGFWTLLAQFEFWLARNEVIWCFLTIIWQIICSNHLYDLTTYWDFIRNDSCSVPGVIENGCHYCWKNISLNHSFQCRSTDALLILPSMRKVLAADDISILKNEKTETCLHVSWKLIHMIKVRKTYASHMDDLEW